MKKSFATSLMALSLISSWAHAAPCTSANFAKLKAGLEARANDASLPEEDRESALTAESEIFSGPVAPSCVFINEIVGDLYSLETTTVEITVTVDRPDGKVKQIFMTRKSFE